MTSIYLLLPGLWLLLSILLAPVIGGFLRRNRRSTSVRLPPLPSGSIDRDWSRQ